MHNHQGHFEGLSLGEYEGLCPQGRWWGDWDTPSLIAPEPCPQDSAEDVHSLDSCEYIWEAGVGFAHSPQPNYIHDLNR